MKLLMMPDSFLLSIHYLLPTQVIESLMEEGNQRELEVNPSLKTTRYLIKQEESDENPTNYLLQRHFNIYCCSLQRLMGDREKEATELSAAHDLVQTMLSTATVKVSSFRKNLIL